MFFGKEKKERDSYGIIGLGRFGYALAESLAESGAELLVIDRDEEKVRAAREFTENAVVIHSMDKKTLKDTGIQNCDVAVVCIGENMEFSILTTLNLVSFGIPTVIAKATRRSMGRSCPDSARRWYIRRETWRSAWQTGWKIPRFSTLSS